VIDRVAATVELDTQFGNVVEAAGDLEDGDGVAGGVLAHVQGKQAPAHRR
jgi:hypothetical protein